jgi:hypothetical protein
MRKLSFAALMLVLCASPAFGAWHFHKKPPKDPRIVQHPKAYHPKNENYKHAPKHKVQKHTSISK